METANKQVEVGQAKKMSKEDLKTTQPLPAYESMDYLYAVDPCGVFTHRQNNQLDVESETRNRDE